MMASSEKRLRGEAVDEDQAKIQLLCACSRVRRDIPRELTSQSASQGGTGHSLQFAASLKLLLFELVANRGQCDTSKFQSAGRPFGVAGFAAPLFQLKLDASAEVTGFSL
ncbi:hypothetical protein MHYP_G00034540 [Metynnis hypsauchen]